MEILQNESMAKDKALNKERLAHQTAQVQRDTHRLEANKAHAEYKQRQDEVEQQIVEIDKLNSIINSMEREMLALKQQYEVSPAPLSPRHISLPTPTPTRQQPSDLLPPPSRLPPDCCGCT